MQLRRSYNHTFAFSVELEIGVITRLAVAISYHPKAIKMFAEELGIHLPDKPEVTDIVGAVITWSHMHEMNNEESAKKVLARKLIILDATWKNKRDELMYTTHARASNTNTYIYIYINIPWKRNHSDSSTGHKNDNKNNTMSIIIHKRIVYKIPYLHVHVLTSQISVHN